MVQVSRRTGFTGSALTRLLAQLSDTDVPESRQALADRLGQWFSWTDAISLSAALDSDLGVALPGARASDATEEALECARLKAALAKANAEGGVASVLPGANDDFPPYRRRYFARQQAMETGIEPLRARLRARLATRSPELARLAAVDAILEQVVGARERSLLATVPALLEKHFKRLRDTDLAHRADQAAQDAHPDNPPPAPTAAGGWLDVFGRDMQSVLRAELDIRMQPVEGLLEALRDR
ncbi:DUF3348 domain-containing protein [Acidovorax cavernicola]|uniref:DUF3348 domain-containing protein n=1 Tax=Acidovorax cavernicola TaxID=1675792 RepID=A0A9X8GW25_9BURK|nr:DUF3348 domain-containing protein [Acidovorax cavernicola]RIX81984.1 DUF3348 domain-containing protein [Acidovorax cavernicola]